MKEFRSRQDTNHYPILNHKDNIVQKDSMGYETTKLAREPPDIEMRFYCHLVGTIKIEGEVKRIEAIFFNAR